MVVSSHDCQTSFIIIQVLQACLMSQSWDTEHYLQHAMYNRVPVSTVRMRRWKEHRTLSLCYYGVDHTPSLIQGVVTYIPAVLTPATGIKIWSGPFLDLDRLIAPLKERWPLIAKRGWAGCGWSQRTRPILTLIWAAQTDVLIAWSSPILQLDRLISLWSRSRVSVQQVYMWPPLE